MTALAQGDLTEIAPPILGIPRLIVGQRFVTGSPLLEATQIPISSGNGYSTVSYSIGTTGQRKNLAAWIQWLGAALPDTIGRSSGTYVVTLKIKGAGNIPDVQEPIISIQWSTERAFLLFDKTVNDVRKTQWAGTLIDEMRLSDTNRRLQFSVEISLSQRSIS